MNNCKNITNILYEDLKNNNTKISKKCFDILNYDLCMIINYNDIWWLEKTSQYNYIPNYFINYLRKYLKRNYNLIYLYDKGEVI